MMALGTEKFPDGFLWGAATAAYQVEGAAALDGRGPSIWDTFSHTPGRIADGSSGDVACDHYRRWREDVELMRELGLAAYRFSVAWPRVVPAGDGRVNDKGLDFYSRLVDALLAAKIVPVVTLYHWDLPQPLQDKGGWTKRATAEAFAKYAAAVAARLGDRVKYWATLNEPQVISHCGYLHGVHAPGLADPAAAVAATHVLNIAHGLGLAAVRKSAPGAKVGIVLNLAPAHPASDSPGDVAAARRLDGFCNRWFLDPVLRGSYPQDICALLGKLAPRPTAADARLISAPIDFLGVNYYSRNLTKDAPGKGLMGTERTVAAGREYTAMGWEVYPQGLRETLLRLRSEYGDPELFVTENGSSWHDLPDARGFVNDERRTGYLREHFRQARLALAGGARLRGYLVWSLMDNYEWSYGYTRRFGITYVDYRTMKRTVKASGEYYKRVIAANAAVD
jgi:beta-glucosidase